MNTLDGAAGFGSGPRWVTSAPRLSFIIVLSQSIVHAIPTMYAFFALPFVFMAFDSLGSSDPLAERDAWLSAWIIISLFGTVFFLAPIVCAMGIVVGSVWLKGQELEVQYQARRLSRLTILVLIVAVLATAISVVIGVAGASVAAFAVALWFAVHAFCTGTIRTRARIHAPAVPGENAGNALAIVLLIGSVLQFWLSAIVAGNTDGLLSGPSSGFTVFKSAVSTVFTYVAMAAGVFGIVVAMRLLCSNKERPAVLHWLKWLSHVHVVLAVVSVPFSIACDAFILTGTYGLKLSSGSVVSSWLTQPIVCTLLLGTLLWVNRQLRRGLGEEAQKPSGPVLAGGDGALYAAVASTDDIDGMAGP